MVKSYLGTLPPAPVLVADEAYRGISTTKESYDLGRRGKSAASSIPPGKLLRNTNAPDSSPYTVLNDTKAFQGITNNRM